MKKLTILILAVLVSTSFCKAQTVHSRFVNNAQFVIGGYVVWDVLTNKMEVIDSGKCVASLDGNKVIVSDSMLAINTVLSVINNTKHIDSVFYLRYYASQEILDQLCTNGHIKNWRKYTIAVKKYMSLNNLIYKP